MTAATSRMAESVGSDEARALQVGVLIDRDDLTGWRKVVLERISKDPAVEIALLIDGSSRRTEPSRAGRAVRSAWKMIDAIEARFSRRLMHRVFAKVNGFAPERLAPNPAGLAEFGGEAPRVTMEDRDAIRAAGLDIVLDLTSESAPGHRAIASNFGTWTLRTAGGRRDAASPLGFWEFYRDQPISEVRLLSSHGDSEDGETIATARYCTYRWSWSLHEVLLGLKASWLVLDTMHRVHNGVAYGEEAEPPHPAPTEAGTGHRERGLQHAPALLARSAARLIGETAYRSLFEDRWRVLLMEAAEDGTVTSGPVVINPPPDRYWADPFAIRRDDKCYIFFEEYPYATQRGVISYLELDGLDDRERLAKPVSRCVIDEAYHLSYPFLFEHRGALFMIPETCANRTIDIWRPVQFPDRWKKYRTIFDGISATDTSLLEWNGKWWLFTNIDRNGMNDHRNELHVFYADNPLEGPWLPHARNPVLIDARVARGAGGFLRTADGLPIRCGQVQGKRYGEAVAYNVVLELSETRYAERPLAGLNPVPITPGARTHHTAYRDGLLVADECLVSSKLARRLGRAR